MGDGLTGQRLIQEESPRIPWCSEQMEGIIRGVSRLMLSTRKDATVWRSGLSARVTEVSGGGA